LKQHNKNIYPRHVFAVG